ncbi:MAG TPA: RHS repeat-associated core domain-containing protein, partial [Actinomycetota bacterium]|nr:RHS repeat-associated core domain-containing protein [Actinomycetota bacterium]
EETIEKRFWYDGLGRQLALVEQAEGGRTVTSGQKEFGVRGQVVREYDPAFTTGFDLVAPAGRYTQHRYDALGRAYRSILPDGSVAEQRYSSFTVERWDAEDLDPASPHHGTPRIDRLTAVGVVEVEERLGARAVVTRFDRDALGRVARVTDAEGKVSTWGFDGLGRNHEIVHSDAGLVTFDFDDAGNVLRRTDARGAYVTTDHDPLGRPVLERLVSRTGAEEERVEYHYDDRSPVFTGGVATGELSWVRDGAGEEHYRRDERGRVVDLVRVVDGKRYRVQRGYDALDRLSSVTFPSGRQIELRYNPRSLLESVPGVIKSIAYDARGKFTRREHANGAVTSASYDELARVATLGTETQGRAVQSLSYGYDRVGNLKRIQDALRSSGPLAAGREYGYDDLYRLVSAAGAGQAWAYAFSDAGDITSKSGVGEYAFGKAHQIASAGERTYLHDEAGNVIERPGSKLAFDAKGRLKTVTLEDGTAVAYRYDFTGRRVVKESHGSGGNHRVVYVDAASEERDGQAVDYVMAGRTRLARIGGEKATPRAAGILARVPPSLTLFAMALFALAACFGLVRAREQARSLAALGSVCSVLALATQGCGVPAPGGSGIAATHYHGDHLGGTALLTAEDGSIEAENAYDPWGAEIAGASEPYGFTGKEYEAETGLIDFGARVYDPELGRFLSPDPVAVLEPEKTLGDSQLLNPYSYARGNPTVFVDRDGRAPKFVAADIADSFERQHEQYIQWLAGRLTPETTPGEMVNLAVLTLAVELGRGMVNMSLRIGQDAAENGAAGWARDALRAVGTGTMLWG